MVVYSTKATFTTVHIQMQTQKATVRHRQTHTHRYAAVTTNAQLTLVQESVYSCQTIPWLPTRPIRY